MRLILTFLSLIATLGYAEEKPVAVACAPFGEEIRMTIQGRAAKLRTPGKAADGKPWLWVAEFPGHLSAFENTLVSSGWHVAFVDCHDQFGSPKAMAIWEAFYQEVTTKYGLSKRPVVCGISRGGLYTLAWARLHPEKISAIYLDAAVTDGRSWPGGKLVQFGKGKGSQSDWKKQLKEFGFADDASALAKLPRPIDGLKAARDSGVDLICVYGKADDVVPWEENGAYLEEFWKAERKNSLIIGKPNVGHHPHGLTDMSPVIMAMQLAQE